MRLDEAATVFVTWKRQLCSSITLTRSGADVMRCERYLRLVQSWNPTLHFTSWDAPDHANLPVTMSCHIQSASHKHNTSRDAATRRHYQPSTTSSKAERDERRAANPPQRADVLSPRTAPFTTAAFTTASCTTNSAARLSIN